MDVFLGEVDSALNALDILVSPIQTLTLCLDLLELSDHGLPMIDSLVDHRLELSYQCLNLLLHLQHGLLVDTLGQLAFNLPLLLLQLSQLPILLFDLRQ